MDPQRQSPDDRQIQIQTMGPDLSGEDRHGRLTDLTFVAADLDGHPLRRGCQKRLETDRTQDEPFACTVSVEV